MVERAPISRSEPEDESTENVERESPCLRAPESTNESKMLRAPKELNESTETRAPNKESASWST